MKEKNLDELKKLISRFTEANSDDKEQALSFYRFYELLTETNKVMNLTAITDFDEVLVKHFEDSLSILDFLKFSANDKVMDLGTGAGFPGIPLKILHPEIPFTFLDSLNKRIAFLQDAANKLNLSDCEFIHGRAEELGHNENYREKYSVVLSRAVANLSLLAEYALPFVKVGGVFVAYKSENVNEEIVEAETAINVLGGEIVSVDRFELKDAGNRAFVTIRKNSETPKKYPRRAGALKKPIKPA